jgi:hypothetical protein
LAWLQSTYTIRLNHRHKLIGHIPSGRYKALLVEGSGNGYLRTACDYVHLNPVRAHLLRPQERLLAYPWTSLAYYLAAPEHRPRWVRVDRLLGEHGLQQDTATARQDFERRMEARRLEPGDEQGLKALRRGWLSPATMRGGCALPVQTKLFTAKLARKWAEVARGHSRDPRVLSRHDAWEQKPILPYPRSVKYRAAREKRFPINLF